MTTAVVLPKTGMGIEEGTLVQWLKAEGDPVKQGEALAVIETAKATMELEAPVTGRLGKILVAAGAIVPVNAEMATIEHD
jgi:pyruvate/2-oxoglutarate dehydrogenase complex dihydrolipoamide acyltransferase (E2) component